VNSFEFLWLFAPDLPEYLTQPSTLRNISRAAELNQPQQVRSSLLKVVFAELQYSAAAFIEGHNKMHW